MKKTKQKQKMSIEQFQTWLDGYCSAQDENWVPNLTQWELIKQKIFSIVANEIEEHKQSNNRTSTGTNNSNANNNPFTPPTIIPQSNNSTLLRSQHSMSHNNVSQSNNNTIITPDGVVGGESAFT